MNILQIPKSTDLKIIDSLYDSLDAYMKKEQSLSLLLSKDLDTKHLSIIASLYQFIFTWVRYEHSFRLFLEINDPNNIEELDRLYDNELVFPIVSMVWNNNEIYNYNGKINLRNFLKPKNSEVFEKMLAGKVFKKNSTLLLTNFDHLKENLGLIPFFESNREFVRNKFLLNKSLKPAINDLLNYSQEVVRNYNEVEIHLVEIIYELMKNTFEWAKDDEYKVPLDPNVRGVSVMFYKATRKTLLSESLNHRGLTDFFNSNIHKENSKGELFFLEISVFDSGRGFIKKFKSLNKEIELSDVDIVKKCLIKHSTSSKGLDKLDKGIGLDKILLILNRKAFLKIKTGSVCVYRNLISHNYYDNNNMDIKNMELFDWKRNSNEQYTEYCNAEGTVISIIYPLFTETNYE